MPFHCRGKVLEMPGIWGGSINTQGSDETGGWLVKTVYTAMLTVDGHTQLCKTTVKGLGLPLLSLLNKSLHFTQTSLCLRMPYRDAMKYTHIHHPLYPSISSHDPATLPLPTFLTFKVIFAFLLFESLVPAHNVF